MPRRKQQHKGLLFTFMPVTPHSITRNTFLFLMPEIRSHRKSVKYKSHTMPYVKYFSVIKRVIMMSCD